MHGTYEANNAMHDCDLLINIGARFDDRITGKIDEFSPKSKKVHIDIDPSSINKIIKVDNTAKFYIESKSGNSISTGGSDWHKYMHPKYQKRIFFPELWSKDELEKWGENE